MSRNRPSQEALDADLDGIAADYDPTKDYKENLKLSDPTKDYTKKVNIQPSMHCNGLSSITVSHCLAVASSRSHTESRSLSHRLLNHLTFVTVRTISLTDWVVILVFQDELGRGQFGTVYRVVDKQSKIEYAMKEISE